MAAAAAAAGIATRQALFVAQDHLATRTPTPLAAAAGEPGADDPPVVPSASDSYTGLAREVQAAANKVWVVVRRRARPCTV